MFYEAQSRQGGPEASRLLYRTFGPPSQQSTNSVATVHVYPCHRLGTANPQTGGTPSPQGPPTEAALPESASWTGRTPMGTNNRHSHPEEQ